MKKEAIVVMDFDDVLVDLSTEVFSRIRSSWSTFSKWFVDSGPLTPEVIRSRPVFAFSEWLLKKEFINLSSKELALSYAEIIADLNKYVFTESIYNTLEPTDFAKKTLLNPLYIDSDNVKKVIILSRNINNEQAKGKERYIKEHFNHPKIVYMPITGKTTKGDVLSKLEENWDLFVDDELKNIRDVAEKVSDLTKKEFLIPELGYNKIDNSLRLLIEEKGGVFTYYTVK